MDNTEQLILRILGHTPNSKLVISWEPGTGDVVHRRLELEYDGVSPDGERLWKVCSILAPVSPEELLRPLQAVDQSVSEKWQGVATGRLPQVPVVSSDDGNGNTTQAAEMETPVSSRVTGPTHTSE